MIIGVTGYKESGKNEIGKILEHWGFYQVALADPVKAMALAIDPWIPDDQMLTFRLAEIVKEYGWEVAKENPEVRRLLQRLGTEAGREVLGSKVWINALQERIWALQYEGVKDFVITDVRFLNEADWITDQGGSVWKVTRPGCESDGHASEAGVDEIEEDVTIVNDGTLDDLWQQVTGALGL